MLMTLNRRYAVWQVLYQYRRRHLAASPYAPDFGRHHQPVARQLTATLPGLGACVAAGCLRAGLLCGGARVGCHRDEETTAVGYAGRTKKNGRLPQAPVNKLLQEAPTALQIYHKLIPRYVGAQPHCTIHGSQEQTPTRSGLRCFDHHRQRCCCGPLSRPSYLS